MKKILTLMIASIFMLQVFVSCSEEDDSNDSTQDNTPKVTQEMIDRYNSVKGIWVVDEDRLNEGETSELKKVILADDKITINDTEYSFDKNKDLWVVASIDYIGFIVGSYKMRLIVMSDADHICFIGEGSSIDVDMKRISTSVGGEEGGGDVSSYVGTYKFTTATGSQKNGSVTFNEDGTFTYSGSATSAPSSGTYTVSDGKITVKFSAAGYETTDTLTVSNNGTSSTWTSDNQNNSVFASTFFGVAGTNKITFTKE